MDYIARETQSQKEREKMGVREGEREKCLFRSFVHS
jgi:hypothetical protein